ncbi:DUF1990 domain-containing protein [Corynebacterium sp. P5875]|uniref:DUF1990 domain-containing protein n=1 Tax=Corynebacterium antarcticum TaxID=2800405 RepID=A0A9Q4GKU0_9CORY|nr:DUF1990 domain-containing protein [Corynebacterium antarcticum]MCX7537068.1 DUF1990 domain-containing protein [Corynebacterium antarcticum]
MGPYDVTGRRWRHWAEELTYPAELMLGTLDLLGGRGTTGKLIDGAWRILDEEIVLGEGVDCFRRASERLMDWRAHRHAGVRVGAWRTAVPGDVVRIHFAGTTSPCLILRADRGQSEARLVHGTLPGHVECGEEAFSVVIGDDGMVRGRIVAFSVHAWWPAKVGAPVARTVQTLITRRYLEGLIP